MNPLFQFTKSVPAFLIALSCMITLMPKAQAVSPAPDGGYPGGNTAEGQGPLASLTTGGFNTAVGFLSLRSDTTGNFNTAIGAGALLANTAANNTATGAGALLSNTTAAENTANGAFALFSNTTGSFNTAVGFDALFRNTTAGFNTANGYQALASNTTGGDNTASGFEALFNNTTGSDNTANGFEALASNTIGSNNTANGFEALATNTTGNSNTALGSGAGSSVTTANHVICIAAPGANVSDSCFISNIRDVVTQHGDAIPVLIDSNNQLGTTSSSRRFKKEIKPMDKASEAIIALKPVTFQYKSDKANTPQFGLVAEEVAEVNPNLVVRDKNGEIYTVRYDAVNAMLLNEFLKEYRKNEERDVTIARQQKQIEMLTSGLQKLSARLAAASPSRGGLELSKPPVRTVANNQ